WDLLVLVDEVSDLFDSVSRGDGHGAPVPLLSGVAHNQPDTEGTPVIVTTSYRYLHHTML
ncbi:hypothetical protein, partial [Brevibacterium sediminis]|uniref:hypothetical protein n=1 Tax=Brevibacterium sediminis TaxID=1857024 RepID=UPI001E5E040B